MNNVNSRQLKGVGDREEFFSKSKENNSLVFFLFFFFYFLLQKYPKKHPDLQ